MSAFPFTCITEGWNPWAQMYNGCIISLLIIHCLWNLLNESWRAAVKRLKLQAKPWNKFAKLFTPKSVPLEALCWRWENGGIIFSEFVQTLFTHDFLSGASKRRRFAAPGGRFKKLIKTVSYYMPGGWERFQASFAFVGLPVKGSNWGSFSII